MKKSDQGLGPTETAVKKNRSGDLYLFHQTVSANHSSMMLNVCEQRVPLLVRAVHAILQTRYPVQCTYEMIKMPRAGVFFFHEVNF